MSTNSGKLGRLFLIPVPLAVNALPTMSAQSLGIIHGLRHFVVENARTARRFIKTTDPPYAIADLVIAELNKHGDNDPQKLLRPLFDGHDMGLMSEAGSPGVADPGSKLVRTAHQYGCAVIPATGAFQCIAGVDGIRDGWTKISVSWISVIEKGQTHS